MLGLRVTDFRKSVCIWRSYELDCNGKVASGLVFSAPPVTVLFSLCRHFVSVVIGLLCGKMQFLAAQTDCFNRCATSPIPAYCPHHLEIYGVPSMAVKWLIF